LEVGGWRLETGDEHCYHLAVIAGCVLAAVLLAVPPVGGADKPDFSGRWVLVNPAAASPATPTELIVRELLSKRGPDLPTVAVERRTRDGSRMATYEVGPAGERGGTEAAWKDSTLVLRTAGEEEIWSLDRQGHLTIATLSHPPGGKPRKVTLIYQRRITRPDN
jgi:hypothetical protein